MTDDTPSDVWLDALRADPPAALARLFELHRERLRRMLEVRLDRRVRGRLGPDDVLQEAYLDAASRLPEFLAAPGCRPTSGCGGWCSSGCSPPSGVTWR